MGDVLGHFPARYRRDVRRNAEKARRRTHVEAAARMTRLEGSRREFVEEPPIMVRLANTEHGPHEAVGLLSGYLDSLGEDRRELLGRFRLMDVARKTVGVGSVGTRCWVALFEGRDHGAGDPLVLQIKEANASVLEPYAGARSRRTTASGSSSGSVARSRRVTSSSAGRRARSPGATTTSASCGT